MQLNNLIKFSCAHRHLYFLNVYLNHHYSEGIPVQDIPMDAISVSEILRLHLESSGKHPIANQVRSAAQIASIFTVTRLLSIVDILSAFSIAAISTRAQASSVNILSTSVTSRPRPPPLDSLLLPATRSLHAPGQPGDPIETRNRLGFPTGHRISVRLQRE